MVLFKYNVFSPRYIMCFLQPNKLVACISSNLSGCFETSFVNIGFSFSPLLSAFCFLLLITTAANASIMHVHPCVCSGATQDTNCTRTKQFWVFSHWPRGYYLFYQYTYMCICVKHSRDYIVNFKYPQVQIFLSMTKCDWVACWCMSLYFTKLLIFIL